MKRLKRYWFPFSLALGLIAYELLFAWLLILGKPIGTTWSGNAFVIHEIARWLATIALAFSIHAAARSVAKDEREARLASLLSVGGIGLGWLYAAALGTASTRSPLLEHAPDLMTSFAVVPTLQGDGGGILALALLIYVMRGAWEAIHLPSRRIAPVIFAIVALTIFRPYAIPLIGIAIALAWAKQIRDAHDRHGSILHPVLLLLSLVPALTMALTVFVAPSVREVRLAATEIPIASWDRWVFALLPVALALAWIAAHHTHRRLFLKSSRWCLVWIVTAAVLTLVLPVPWHGVYTEGLMVPLVFVTLPFWSALTDALPKLARTILIAGLVSASALSLVASQLAWLSTQ